MKTIRIYGFSILKTIIFLLLSILILSLLEYCNILSEKATSFFLFLSLLTILVIESYQLSKKGYLLGLEIIFILVINSIINNKLQYKLILYYIIIEITSYMGYFIRKKKKK